MIQEVPTRFTGDQGDFRNMLAMLRRDRIINVSLDESGKAAEEGNKGITAATEA